MWLWPLRSHGLVIFFSPSAGADSQAEVTPGLISLATQVRVKARGVNNFYKWIHFSFSFSCSDSLALGTSENTGFCQLEGHVGLCQAVYERD